MSEVKIQNVLMLPNNNLKLILSQKATDYRYIRSSYSVIVICILDN